VYIYDANDLLKPPPNKKGRADMAHLARVWTAGAVDHIDIQTIKEPLAFLRAYRGRCIGTVVDEKAVHLRNFSFQSDDLLLFGSEKNGLPAAIQAELDASVYIPARGHTDCLNVAVSFGIVLDQALATLKG
ncbi:MAG: TrmH family RNA methyltransferase, partial [Bacteroidetes bacterium]